MQTSAKALSLSIVLPTIYLRTKFHASISYPSGDICRQRWSAPA